MAMPQIRAKLFNRYSRHINAPFLSGWGSLSGFSSVKEEGERDAGQV